MKLSRMLLAAMAMLSLTFAQAEVSEGGLVYTKENVGAGEWINSHFLELKKQADDENIPLVVFWANPGCAYCKKLEAAMNEPDAQEWRKKSGYLFAFALGTGTTDNSKAKSFAKHASGKFPYVAFYWKKEGTTGEGTKFKYSGRNGSMKFTGGTLQSQFMQTADFHFAGFKPPYDGGTFAVEESEGNRLEAEAATKSVKVELVREGAEATEATTSKMTIVKPNGTKSTKTITWTAGQEKQTVSVDIAAGTFSKAGDALTLAMIDDEGTTQSVTHVTYVTKATSAANPLWIGEKFGFGEWTCDIDGAKDLVSKTDGEAYTLVSIQGSMWCPDCANTDRNFLEVEDGSGNNKFAAWAKSKNVALVAMDIPNYNGPTVANRATPTLFSTNAYATALARAGEYPQSGADASLTNKIVRSGLGYMTRKGITAEAAEAQLKKFHDLAYNNTDKGGFHRPEDGNKNRTGVPIFVLLRKDGSVAARFTRFAAVSPMSSDKANFDNYIKRFEEMLTLAGSDSTEIANNYPGADHPLAMAANDGELTSTLCNADFQDAVKLTGLTGGAKQVLSITGESDASVTLQLYSRTADGAVASVGNARTCAKLSTGLTIDFEVKDALAAEYFVMVKGANITSADFDAASSAAGHFISYTLTGTTEYLPTESAQSGITDAEGKAIVTLVSNQMYRISNVSKADCQASLKPISANEDEVFYRALKSDAVELTFLTAGGQQEFTYQLWNSGEVGFEKADVTVAESVNDKENDYVKIAVTRQGGTSGEVAVEVTLNPSTDLYNVDFDEESGKVIRGAARFEFATTNLVWEDGKSGTQYVLVRILDDSNKPRFDGNGKVVLALSDPVGPAMDVGKGADVFTLNVTEDDKAVPGRAMFTRVEPYYGKAKTVYVRESEGAKLWAERIEGSEGLFGVEVKSSLAGVAFAAENERDLTTENNKQIFWWSNKESDEKYLKVLNVPAGKTAKVTIGAYTSGDVSSKVVSASNTVTVVGVADDAPYFTGDLAKTIYRYVAISNTVAVLGTTGGKLTFTKLSGTLPAGLKVVYDAALQGLAVVGTPTATDSRTGVKSHEAVYQVTEERIINSKKTKVPGLTVRISYDVVDPAETDGKGGEPINEFFATSRTYSDLIVLDPETGSLVGTLTLTLPRTGRASGKFKCALGTLSYSAKNWSALEGCDLQVVLTCSTSGYKASQIEVVAANDGQLAVTLSGVSGETWTLASGKFWTKNDSAEDYQGTYTVALPFESAVTDPLGLAPNGAGYLTLKMTSSSQWNSGKMTWAGLLGNGTAISGSAVLTRSDVLKSEVLDLEEGGACLPVFAQSKTDVFGAVAAIVKGAKARSDEGGSKECYRAVSAAVFQTEEFGDVVVKPRWSHTENSKTVENAKWNVTYGLYGSIYNLKNGLDCCCEETDVGKDIELGFASGVSQAYGDLGPVTPVRLIVTEKGVSLVSGQENPHKVTVSVNSFGIVSGSFKLPYGEGSATLAATYKGVVLIGWGADCGTCHEGEELDLPFIMGGWTIKDKYTDTKSGKSISIKRGETVEGKKFVDEN